MAWEIGSQTLSTTGLKTINMGFASAPTSVMIVVQNKYATNESTVKHVSIASTDGTNHNCASYFKKGTDPSSKQRFTDGTVIYVQEEIGGVIQPVFQATFNSFYTNGIKLNVSQANSAYPVYIYPEN